MLCRVFDSAMDARNFVTIFVTPSYHCAGRVSSPDFSARDAKH
jgi:hypothetical protein